MFPNYFASEAPIFVPHLAGVSYSHFTGAAPIAGSFAKASPRCMRADLSEANPTLSKHAAARGARLTITVAVPFNSTRTTPVPSTICFAFCGTPQNIARKGCSLRQRCAPDWLRSESTLLAMSNAWISVLQFGFFSRNTTGGALFLCFGERSSNLSVRGFLPLSLSRYLFPVFNQRAISASVPST